MQSGLAARSRPLRPYGQPARSRRTGRGKRVGLGMQVMGPDTSGSVGITAGEKGKLRR